MDTGGTSSRVRADINVTPLVDIVLVLLIIFIVITPAVNDAVRLPVAKHSLKPEAGQGQKPLSLLYLAQRDAGTGAFLGPGQVLVETREGRGALQSFSLEAVEGRKQLAAFVARAVREQGDKRVLVKADAAMPFKYVHELFQLCREAGALEASIVTREEKGGV
jgi:biopolymer transport protein ExbD